MTEEGKHLVAWAEKYAYEPDEYTGRSSVLISDTQIEAQMKRKGLKMFSIDGVDIWALNLKNAKRKRNNMPF